MRTLMWLVAGLILGVAKIFRSADGGVRWDESR